MRTTVLVTLATLISTAVYAQAPATPQLIELDDDQTNVTVLGASVDQVEDMDLFDTQGVKLGEVEAVLGTDADTASAVAIDLENTDDTDVVISLSDLTLQDGRLVTALTAQALGALPEWDD